MNTGAGGAAPKPFLETTAHDLADAFRLNVLASFELMKRAVPPHLLENEGASVINTSSRMDRLVAREHLTYGTVQAAVTQMTRLLAAELAPRLRVNEIALGLAATEGSMPPSTR